MNNNTLIPLILLVLIVIQGSDASLLAKLRSMAAVPSEANKTQMSPSPAPMLNQHDDVGKSGGAEKPKKPEKPKKLDNSTDANLDVKVNPVNETDLNQGVVNETCEGTTISRCVKKKMIGCLKHHPETGSQDLIILIQNEGESLLNVSIIAPTSVKISTKELEIPQHKAKKVNASASVGESHKIVLNAGSGDCVLHTAVPIPPAVPIPQGNFFQKIPYANQVTPMYGAYFMFAVVLITGGTWACCKFGRKGRHDTSGVPYQELEMSVPVSASAGNGNGNGNAEEGWDQGWDDDWDEEGAVKTPGKHVGNVSGNGLTSRSSNKDGWENDWDD